MRFREIERILLADGWRLKAVKGSHYHYVHPNKPAKITVPYRSGDLNPRTVKSIFEQADCDPCLSTKSRKEI